MSPPAPEDAPDSPTRPLALALPYATVLVSSFCVMVVELVAGRLVAKHLGSSIYTWTSVIGMILAGIALGNYVGGWIADRCRPVPTIAAVLGLAGLVSVAVPVIDRWVAEAVWLWTLSWPMRVSLHVAAVFLLPAALLGTVSPIAGRMALLPARRVGRALGSLYAWGVVGSLLGTFLTGYYLIPALGTVRLLWLVAGVLAGFALLLAGSSFLRWSALGAIFLLGALQTAPWTWAETLGTRTGFRPPTSPDMLLDVESLYADIQVLSSHVGGAERRHLKLDKMVHNVMLVASPTSLQDIYLRIFRELCHAVRPSKEPIRTLTIGGGAYLFPRYVEEQWPGSTTEVVEIDPEVTRVAGDFLGLAGDTRIRTYAEDGRVFVNRLVRERRSGEPVPAYDFIFLDAFNDYSVPPQLTTLEFVDEVSELLAPSGAYLINLIDSFETGLLLGAMVQTLEQRFPYVRVFFVGSSASLRSGSRETFVVLASRAEVELGDVDDPDLAQHGLHHLTEAQVAGLRARTSGVVLTDDWAPTENLLAPVVRASAAGLAATALMTRGLEALARGDADRAEKLLHRAVSVEPWNAPAHRTLGDIYRERGDFAKSRVQYDESLHFDPSQRDLFLALAQATAERGLPADAIQYLRRTLQQDPSDLGTKMNLGILLARADSMDAAVDVFAEIVQAEPGSFAAQRTLGLALFQEGKLEEAAAHLEAAERIQPGDDAVREHLAKIRAARGGGGRGNRDS